MNFDPSIPKYIIKDRIKHWFEGGAWFDCFFSNSLEAKERYLSYIKLLAFLDMKGKDVNEIR